MLSCWEGCKCLIVTLFCTPETKQNETSWYLPQEAEIGPWKECGLWIQMTPGSNPGSTPHDPFSWLSLGKSLYRFEFSSNIIVFPSKDQLTSWTSPGTPLPLTELQPHWLVFCSLRQSCLRTFASALPPSAAFCSQPCTADSFSPLLFQVRCHLLRETIPDDPIKNCL